MDLPPPPPLPPDTDQVTLSTWLPPKKLTIDYFYIEPELYR